MDDSSLYQQFLLIFFFSVVLVLVVVVVFFFSVWRYQSFSPRRRVCRREGPPSPVNSSRPPYNGYSRDIFFLSSSSSSSFISIIPLALQSLSSGCNSIPYYSEEGEKAEEREENKSSIAAVCSCDHHHIHDDITVVRPIR